MPHTQRLFTTCVVFAALFTFLFHGTGIGLNLLLFETTVLIALFAMRRIPLRARALLPVMATLLTAVMVMLYGSTIAVVVNLVSLLLTLGVLLATGIDGLHHSAALAAAHLVEAPRMLLRTAPVLQRHGGGSRITSRGVLSITLVPLIVLLFSALYSASNPYFDEITTQLFDWIGLNNASMPFMFLIGLAVSASLFLVTRNERIMRWARSSLNTLAPSGRHMDEGHHRAVHSEAAIGILLLGSLNALLLLLNVLDVQHVWLDFHFTGQYLKAFVHEGTWMLIVSILLGAAIVLYYFRGDQNFHSGNGTIKAFSYLWLAQNVVLVISVAIRNYWYIHHYALAYKRIGVGFFLLATLVGLILIMLKVRFRRSRHFLVRWNMVSLYAIAVLMTLVDWDVLIARYNMAHRERAFVELNYLAALDDKALPHLMATTAELERLDRYNKEKLGDASRYHRNLYLTPKNYQALMAQRTKRFLLKYPERSWREWNLADANAFVALNSLTDQIAL